MNSLYLLSSCVLFSCVSCAASHAYAADNDAALARSAIADYYNTGANPTIEQSRWTSNSVFNVGVHYMGSDDNDTADEVCKVLAERGIARNTKVRVIDINSMGSDPSRWEVVGQATCR